MASETRPRLLRVKSSPTFSMAVRPATIGIVGLAAAVAIGAGLALPRAAYTAAAVVGVDGGPAGLRPALIQAAADTARSRQVASRAAAALPAKLVMQPEALAAALQVDAGRVPGTLVLRASDANAERAASLASALAGALVAELEDRAAAIRRDGDAAGALRLSRLQEIAGEVHRKLAALGGDSVDPALAHTSATNRAEALRARLDAIRSILAAGNPPLGTGRDLPPTIEALQTGYLDLTRQLAKARETLGERHTTVIGLQESVRRAATELTAAWGRLAKATAQELSDARAAASAKAGLDPQRGAAIDAARAAARLADDAVARAATPHDDDDEARWRLVARASAPALPDGLGLPLRLALAAAAGVLVLLFGRWSMRRPREVAPAAAAKPLPLLTPIEPAFFDETVIGDIVLASVTREAPPAVEPCAESIADAPARDDAWAPSGVEQRDFEEMLAETSAARPTQVELTAALAPLLPVIDAVAPRAGVPIILVATDVTGIDTTGTALALGAAAAAGGCRVLIVETHARPALGAAAASDAEPALIEVLGETRIVLRAESGAGQVYLAPAFAGMARLATDLARAGTATVADDLADEFDLVVVDGGRAWEAAALVDEADAFLQVARNVPARAGSFLTALGPSGTFLGTVATAVPIFVPPVASPRAVAPSARQRVPLGPHPLRRSAQVDARRRVGAR